jgi:ornithine cyclodeaminase/alanine dehydrogenase-like protein (mu-crystallin family)
VPTGTLHIMAAGAPSLKAIGFKAYYATSKGTRYFVQFFGVDTGELEATVEGSWLGMMRTGQRAALRLDTSRARTQRWSV